ncbi:MAG: hypothetical protein NTW31_02545 [Bacteroidetes bacterium]|nr:hypothetical protein [Bacteroidota bacterium]
MQEKDTIEEYYRKAFSEFEPPPPEQAWEKIKAGIHPLETKKGSMEGFKKGIAGFYHSRNLYPLLAAAAMVLLLVMIFVSYSNKHSIRGHAYAGEARICMGTAYLFKVYDKAKPLDTLKLVQSVSVDNNGFYQFSGIDNGNYLIRINPLPGSEITRNFMPSYYDQDSAFREAIVIKIQNEDPTVDIHLIPR